MRLSQFFLITLLAFSLTGCSWITDLGEKISSITNTLPSDVATAQALITPAIRSEAAYNELTSCKAPAAPAPPFCRDILVTRRLKSLRLGAYSSLNQAAEAAKTAKTAGEKAKATELFGAANSAALAFKQFADVFNPAPAATTP